MIRAFTCLLALLIGQTYPVPGPGRSAFGTPPPSPTLVGKWLVNEGLAATVALDSSGNGNNATWAGTKVCTALPSYYQGGYVLTYAGCTYDTPFAYINAGNASVLNPTTSLSLSAWVMFFSTPTNAAEHEYQFITRDDAALGRSYNLGYVILLGSTMSWEFAINGTNLIVYTNTPVGNAWHHICATTYTGGSKLYLDGTSVGTGAWAVPGTTTGPTEIGARSYSGFEDRFPGQIEDVRVYSGVADCAAIYAAGPG